MARPAHARAATGRLRLRVRGPDGLGLRRALSDRLLPALVAAMTFLAALALAGAVGASLLAGRWSAGAATVLTVQVPQLDGQADQPARVQDDRIAAVLAILRAEPALGSVHLLDRDALVRLLAPWLGGAGGVALPLPAVVQVRLRPGVPPPPDLSQRLDQAAPGTLLERNGDWSDRLVALTTSLQACAGLALLVVAGVAVAVVAVATRAGLAARRQAIEIVHGLGATDSYIAGRFAGRTTRLALLGGAAGTLLSIPLLLLLCRLAAPFATAGAPVDPAQAATAWAGPLQALPDRLPQPLWIALPLLPLVAAAIGWTTAQATVRTWLRRLP